MCLISLFPVLGRGRLFGCTICTLFNFAFVFIFVSLMTLLAKTTTTTTGPLLSSLRQWVPMHTQTVTAVIRSTAGAQRFVHLCRLYSILCLAAKWCCPLASRCVYSMAFIHFIYTPGLFWYKIYEEGENNRFWFGGVMWRYGAFLDSHCLSSLCSCLCQRNAQWCHHQ